MYCIKSCIRASSLTYLLTYRCIQLYDMISDRLSLINSGNSFDLYSVDLLYNTGRPKQGPANSVLRIVIIYTQEACKVVNVTMYRVLYASPMERYCDYSVASWYSRTKWNYALCSL